MITFETYPWGRENIGLLIGVVLMRFSYIPFAGAIPNVILNSL